MMSLTSMRPSMPSSDEGEAPKVLTISDAKEIFVPHSRTRILISNNVLTTDENGTHFIKFEPGRNVQIAKLIVSRCSKRIRAIVCKDKSFWTAKSKEGNKFVSKLRRLLNDAIKLKFDVRGKRFLSRVKQQRCKQLVLEAMPVALPTVGKYTGKSINMRVDMTAHRKNGRSSLWIQLDPVAIDHIAHMACEFFCDDFEDEYPVDHDDDDDDKGIGDSYPHGDDARESVSAHEEKAVDHEDEDEAVDHEDEDEDGDVSVPSAESSSSPSVSSSSPSVRKSSPLFDAFMRGAQKP
jgi:hypothetical protein